MDKLYSTQRWGCTTYRTSHSR